MTQAQHHTIQLKLFTPLPHAEFNPRKRIVKNPHNSVWLKAYVDALLHNRPLSLMKR